MNAMDEMELLKTAVRETRLSAGIGGELATRANESPGGLDVKSVGQALEYWRTHLLQAYAAVMRLEEIAARERMAALAKLKG